MTVSLNKGIILDNGERLSMLMYADDVVFLSENEQDLQDVLTILSDWCEQWGLLVNGSKSSIVHFRNKSVSKSDFKFTCGNINLDTVERYKYLGLWLTEHLDYDIMASEVAKSAQRALGLLIAKAKSNGGMPFSIYTKLYDALVLSVITYGAAVWGQKSYSSVNAVNNRAIRFYLGVGKYTPNAAVQGDSGWVLPSVHQWISVTKQWCRLCNMDDRRLTKKIFSWAEAQALEGQRNWIHKCKKKYADLNLNDIADTRRQHHIAHEVAKTKETLIETEKELWLREVQRTHARNGPGLNKLRTYRLFKSEYHTEPYLTTIMPYQHRRAFAQFRCGVSPLRIETGRYEGLAVEQRTCFHCENTVEDEFHVVTTCPLYNDLRAELYEHCVAENSDFLLMSCVDKMCFILSSKNIVRTSARILCDILLRRRNLLYNV